MTLIPSGLLYILFYCLLPDGSAFIFAGQPSLLIKISFAHQELVFVVRQSEVFSDQHKNHRIQDYVPYAVHCYE